VYNRRQKAAEDRRKDQEILIAQIQTAEKFIPHLASDNEQTKAAALIYIGELGNPNLAVSLATAFGGRGATRALTEIAASGAGTEAGRSAQRALIDLLRFLQLRVVTLHSRGLRLATGLIVSPQGLIVTSRYAMRDADISQLQVKLPSGQMADVFERVLGSDVFERKLLLMGELALLKTAGVPFRILHLTPTTRELQRDPLELGEPVVALLLDPDGNFRVQLGTVTGRWAGVTECIAVSLPVEPGSSGTPVVDREGRLLGLVEATDLTGLTYLIPAEEIFALLEKVIPPDKPY
jgi:S1-C subfamily serine protease